MNIRNLFCYDNINYLLIKLLPLQEKKIKKK
jgi:hypothetical protein